MKPTAIDLLWLRPSKVGGTESYTRNLLDGLRNLPDDFDFTLLVSKDNADTFTHYTEDSRFHLLVAPIENANIAKRILWQNAFQNSFLRKNGIRRCFVPVYCKPWLNGGVEYICSIMDILLYHYPKFHPFHEVAYSRLCWRMDVITAKRILTISNWVKEDFESKYKGRNLEVFYTPILIKKDQMSNFSEEAEKFDIEDRNFFYTVSQLIPHKNLKTIISVMERIVKDDLKLPHKLLISGVNGNAAKELKDIIEEKGLTNNILMTGFVSNETRNCLYAHAHTFLFPSIFEGFGMPPVEAMYLDTRVVTTKCASLPEVTQDKAIYVDDPFSVDEWIEKITNGVDRRQEMDYSPYDPATLSKRYLELLSQDVWARK